MGCDYVRIGDTTAIVCSRGRRSKARAPKCVACSKLAAAFQCDWILRRTPKIQGGKQSLEPVRCDAHLCADHAREIAPNKHVCPVHSITFDNWKKEREANASSLQPGGK